MKIFLVLVLTLGVALGTVSARRGRGDHRHNWNNTLTCRGEPIMNRESLWAAKRECFNEIMATTATTPTPEDDTTTTPIARRRGGWRRSKKRCIKSIKKDSCYKVCVYKKENILNENGTYNSTETEKLIQRIVPSNDQIQLELKAALDNCAEEHGSTFSLDNGCEGYNEFKMCKKSAFQTVCGLGEGRSRFGRRHHNIHNNNQRNQNQTNVQENEIEDEEVNSSELLGDAEPEVGP